MVGVMAPRIQATNPRISFEGRISLGRSKLSSTRCSSDNDGSRDAISRSKMLRSQMSLASAPRLFSIQWISEVLVSGRRVLNFDDQRL